MRFPFRQVHEFEDAQRNFEYAESYWGQLQGFDGIANVRVWAGTGVPANANGSNGDIYVRKDGAAGTFLYQRSAGVWAAIL